MLKVIKEIIIVLLVILLSILIFAVALYEYIPNKIQTKQISEYAAPEDVKTLLQESVSATGTEEVILTYEVTSNDLTNYEKAKEYVPGKQDPFAVFMGRTEDEDATNSTNTGSGGSGTSSGNTTKETKSNTIKNDTNTTNTTSSYFKDTGTK